MLKSSAIISSHAQLYKFNMRLYERKQHIVFFFEYYRTKRGNEWDFDMLVMNE